MTKFLLRYRKYVAMRAPSTLMAALMLSSPSLASSSEPIDASKVEMAPTSDQVIAYLLKGGPPKPERIFQHLPATNREGLRFGEFENAECLETARYRGKIYWQCHYTETAFTRSGTKLTSRKWQFLAHDGKGGLQPIMLETVPMPLAPTNAATPKAPKSP